MLSSIQTYKLLVDAVGKLNSKAVALMNGKCQKEEAQAVAIAVLADTLARLQEDQPAPPAADPAT